MSGRVEAANPEAAVHIPPPATGSRAAIENAIAARRAEAEKSLNHLHLRVRRTKGAALDTGGPDADEISKLFGLRTIIDPRTLMESLTKK